MGKDQKPETKHSLEVSRRGFLTGAGAVISSSIVAGTESLQGARHPSGVNVFGPAKVSMTIKINGIQRTVELEPRITLLDALRSDLDLTGAKKVCDRGTCGSCTVMIDDKPAYACSILAIEAQNKDVRTIEGLAQGNNMHPVQQAFVENDAQQCGYCTPGFIMATVDYLSSSPSNPWTPLRHLVPTFHGVDRISRKSLLARLFMWWTFRIQEIFCRTLQIGANSLY